ncbi:MAG: hypothetical protein JO050_08265 [Acidimicrobiia bacterium]|nr:hypothetical protein [Acidimicrobiia bacterium]MBV8560754.1 hypothetical protein [Acidimicrobiia bacterium]
MSDHKNPIDQALDVFVFAPLGLLLSAPETIPAMAEKGRQYWAAARAMGEYALGQGREQAEKAVRQAGDQAGQTLSLVGGLTPRRSSPSRRAAPTAPSSTSPASPPPAHAPTGSPPMASRQAPAPAAHEDSAASAAAAADTGGNGRVPGPGVESLAIPGYDTLSASQVVQRLGGLSADELEAVRAYEESGRKRKTILARVQQLQSGS